MSYPENWLQDSNRLPMIDTDYIPKQLIIGNKYHLSWAASKAMIWVLKEIIGSKVILETPKTKRQLVSNHTDLRETNSNAYKNTLLRNKRKLKY